MRNQIKEKKLYPSSYATLIKKYFPFKIKRMILGLIVGKSHRGFDKMDVAYKIVQSRVPTSVFPLN
jgi:hypothetical protein